MHFPPNMYDLNVTKWILSGTLSLNSLWFHRMHDIEFALNLNFESTSFYLSERQKSSYMALVSMATNVWMFHQIPKTWLFEQNLCWNINLHEWVFWLGFPINQHLKGHFRVIPFFFQRSLDFYIIRSVYLCSDSNLIGKTIQISHFDQN